MGSTIIEPGAETKVLVSTRMHAGMGGPHLFEITLRTNDPVAPELKVYFRADFG